MVVVPAGTFLMGCLAEEDCRDEKLPEHEVNVAKFALGKYEITFAEFDKFAKATDSRLPEDFGWGRDNQPVLNISWNEAQSYVVWLTKETGEPYRLPSESEWEYAARAGSKTAFSFGDDVAKLCEYANHADSSTKFSWRNTSCSDDISSQPATVGNYKANSWGLHDMHGNVWEWLQDCWYEDYSDAPTDGSARTNKDCDTRVVRGGSFTGSTSMVSSSCRIPTPADYPSHLYGFRVARTFESASPTSDQNDS